MPWIEQPFDDAIDDDVNTLIPQSILNVQLTRECFALDYIANKANLDIVRKIRT